MPREQLAWYLASRRRRRAAHGHPRRRRLGLSRRSRGAPRRLPSALRARAQRARCSARWRDAIDVWRAGHRRRRSIPPRSARSSDAYAAIGDTREERRVRSRARRRRVEAAGRVPSRVESLPARSRPPRRDGVRARFARSWRRGSDVYAYDLLAWALHKQGRDREAAVAMAARCASTPRTRSSSITPG